MSLLAAVAVVVWQAADCPSGQFLVELGACRGRYSHQCALYSQEKAHIVVLSLEFLSLYKSGKC